MVKGDSLFLTGSEQGEKIANNNGFGSAISKLIRTSFFLLYQCLYTLKNVFNTSIRNIISNTA